jgi:tetratricopeptide (TPR) repeat protein
MYRAGGNFLLCSFLLMLFSQSSYAQVPAPEQIQVGPPPMHRVEPPPAQADPADLEKRGDELRASKYYLDALDYYNAALAKKPNNALLLNKLGIAELQLHHWKEAKKAFERSIKADKNYADAYNNLGVVEYIEKKYGKAIKRYTKAIDLRQDAASYFSNLGAAYFSKREFDKAVLAYSHAVELDPDVFERTSQAGVSAQLPSPEDRAHYNYVMAKLYAKMGATERALQYLRRAMEEGYKKIDDVYKDGEFVELRKDKRFEALMASRPPAISD